jgi:group I intron endonuclease
MFTVYKITNTETGKSYIGYTSLTPQERWIQHVYESGYKSKTKFKKSIRKHGVECWTHEILKTTETKEEAVCVEIEMIKFFDTYRTGYNSTLGGEGNSGARSAETCLKISAAKAGTMVGEKNPNFGNHKPLTEEHRRKVGISKLGNNHNLGKKQTEDHVKNMTNAISEDWTITNPNNAVSLIRNLNDFCRLNFKNWHSAAVTMGKKGKYKGWTALRGHLNVAV